MKKDFRFREIPYNYTSFSDKEIILKYFDAETLQLIERLRSVRITGRSAKLLSEVIGDIFIVERNPYIFEDFLRHPGALARLRKLHSSRLDTIAEAAAGMEPVFALLEKARAVDERFFRSFAEIRSLRSRVLYSLSVITNRRNISFEPFHRVAHATDATDWRVEYPFVVVFPETAEELPLLVRAARRLGLSIIPRGGGTGLTGGAIPVRRNTMVVNLEKLNRIGEIEVIEEEERTIPVIEVDAGAVTDHVIEHCAEEGYIFATDPTSAWASTIGGNIAENAGGKKCVRWGTAIDNLYSYTLIDPEGRILLVKRRAHPYRKIEPEDTVVFDVFDASAGALHPLKSIALAGTEIRKRGLGKDITNKALGGLPGVQKEGGDGIITTARFVLYEPFRHCTTVCLEFFGRTMQNASNAIVEIKNAFERRTDAYLTALEHFDEQYVLAINYRNKSARTERPKAVLLIDIESNDPAAPVEAAASIKTLAERFNTEAVVAASAAERSAFWQDRKNLGAIARHTNAFKLNEDIVIPVERLPEFADFVERKNCRNELLNSLRILEHLREIIGALRAARTEAGPPEERLAEALHHCSLMESRYRRCLEHLSRPAADVPGESFLPDSRETVFRLIQEGRIVLSLESDVLTLFRGMFHGYDEFLAEIDRSVDDERKRRIIVATHMHAGDGNVHVNIPVHSNDYLMMQEAEETAADAMREAVRLGGVVSGEHGIGLTKLRFIEREALDAYQSYKREADPDHLFNPGKLASDFPLHSIYTPSFNLLELEAFILKATELERLSTSIAACVRCGKCKTVCCTHYPRGGVLFNPRNKILAVGMITEAVLYFAQTLDMRSFTHFTKFGNIADHCTVCHKCQQPCPVKIDFGAVTMALRELLVQRRKAASKPMTSVALYYLSRKRYRVNKLFRFMLLKAGYSAQRTGHRVNRFVSRITTLVAPPLNDMLSGKFPRSGDPSLRELLKLTGHTRFFSFENPAKPVARSVFYFPGCGSERMFPEISLATVAMLYEAGVRVVIPPEYLCCGYPFLANGRSEQAEIKSYENRVIMHRIADVAGYMEIDTVLVSCGTCFDMLEKYEVGNIFKGARLMDVNEYLVQEKLYPRPSAAHSVLYHEPCHTPLRRLGWKAAVPALTGSEAELVPNCCGEAGTLALSRPDISAMLRKRKRESAAECGVGAEAHIVTSCPSCVFGLSKMSNGISVEGKSLIVMAAERHLGKDWKKKFLGDVRRSGVEKILL